MSRIVCLHGVPKKIVSNRGTQFTLKFWERLHETLDTKLRFSSAYHPQTNGQTERVNQILEDMLRAYALQYGRSWDKSRPYTEFSYNNSYQESSKMTPFEMLYGQRCRTSLFWSETGEQKKIRPDILQEAKKQVCMVRENLQVAQSRQKSYADHRRRELKVLLPPLHRSGHGDVEIRVDASPGLDVNNRVAPKLSILHLSPADIEHGKNSSTGQNGGSIPT
jgi:hypothetical protein